MNNENKPILIYYWPIYHLYLPLSLSTPLACFDPTLSGTVKFPLSVFTVTLSLGIPFIAIQQHGSRMLPLMTGWEMILYGEYT